jgi:hypothetical protein
MNNADSPDETIEAWRRQGDHRLDPVRFHFIEALARRSAGHAGLARQALDQKLTRLLAAYGADLEQAASADRLPAAAGTAQRGPLPELVDRMAVHKPPRADGSDPGHAGPALGYFRNTWSRLSADRRLTQSRAKLPRNAGPLHSHHLVHRSLLFMREVSPGYLHRFMSHVDALLGLDQMEAAGAPKAEEAPRAGKGRKKARGRHTD